MAKDIIKYIKNINRKPSVPRRLLEQFIAKGASTIPELSKGIGVSLPTTTNALNELMGQGLVREIGKKADSAGRIPMVYDLQPTAGYFVGVNPEMDCLALEASDFCGNLITEKQKVPYVYENTPESLAEMGKIINVFIDNLPIKREEILEVCVNVAERVRPLDGRAYNMFNFLEESLAEKLTELLELPTCIENDSRSMTYGEFVKGCCKGKKDVIFVNVCWGLGIGIIIDGKLYQGKSGFSGEIGHMHIYNNDIICHCGKTGCMETETSGSALLRKMNQKLQEGGTSVLTDKVMKQHQELTLQDILDAIKKEDVLSIESLQRMAVELGTNLAGIINTFTPEMLVIGGDLSVTGDYLTQPICMGIKKFSLNMVSEDSQIVTSALKDHAGLIGACLMARSKILQGHS